MPLYEYACRNCGHQFEARHKISDELIKICPSCSHSAVERLVSRSSFALKGSGWYADGYGAKGAKDASEAPAKTEPAKTEAAKPEAGAAAPTSTAETTPAAKPEGPKKDSAD